PAAPVRRTLMAHRAGYVAIVGRPNVGKSTLLNALVGAKVAIVTPKPQTTRNRILGIRTLPDAQVVFLDTPGIHEGRSLINRRMVEVARQALGEADVVLAVIDASAGVTPADRELVAGLAALRATTIVVLSKRDRVGPPALLPLMATLGTLLPGGDIVPVSARTGENVPAVLDLVVKALPESPRLYPEDEYTTETQRFLVQELIREQLFLQTDEEIPYGTAVEVEEFTEKPERNVLVLQATILVDREGHKGIIIGKGGERLREIGRRARLEVEALFGLKVFLELFVRAEPGWARNARRLKELGL
ncbi:MAG TPA: GTPase Era, partial [Candidatus Binatus sp.]|nr:GTPase Era [Candidatus Binatus sp.]